MKNSGISSTSAAPPLPSGSARNGFALTGPTVPLDPRTHAVRGDLADVRLAEFVFAPHYAAPAICRLIAAATLRTGRGSDSEPLADLPEGAGFEVLEFAGPSAWGIASELRVVGYLDAAALACA